MLAPKVPENPSGLADAMIASVREPLLILDSHLRVRTANKCFYDLFRVTRSDTEGCYLFDLGNGQWNIPVLRKLLVQILPAQLEVNDFEVRHRFPEIGHRVMAINARRLAQPGNGEPLIFLAIEDVTNKVAETRALKESRDFATGIIETLRDPLLVLTSDLAVVTANSAFYQAFSYSADQTEGKKIYDLNNGAWNIPRLRVLLEDTLAKNTTFRDFEIDHVFPRIGRKVLLLNGRRVYERGERTERILLVIEDVTEHRRLDRFIRFQADALNRVNDAVVAIDKAGKITYWNSGAERVFNIPLGTAMALQMKDVCKTIGDSSDGLFATSPGGYPWREYHVRLRESKEERFLESSAHDVVEDDGTSVGSLIVLRDVTARKKGELELKRTNEELELFASIASHDLQEPLRMVTMYVGLLAKTYQGKLGEDADTYMRFALEGTARMKSLVNDLLKYARIQIDPETFRTVSLRNIVDQVVGDLQVSIKETGAVLRIGDLPHVSADEGKMRQVFQNLISNAIRYRSRERPLVITIGAEERPTEWVISVQDNGIGFDIAYASHVFKLFQRLEPRTSDSGTGIGLTITKKIIESHLGRIWVESTPGVGSKFFFSLPRPLEQE